SFVLILRKYPAADLRTVFVFEILHGEFCYTDCHHLGGYRRVFPPMCEAAVFGEDGILYKFTIGDYFVMGWCGDKKLDRCFIGHIVHTGDPMLCTIGPVVGKES